MEIVFTTSKAVLLHFISNSIFVLFDPFRFALSIKTKSARVIISMHNAIAITREIFECDRPSIHQFDIILALYYNCMMKLSSPNTYLSLGGGGEGRITLFEEKQNPRKVYTRFGRGRKLATLTRTLLGLALSTVMSMPFTS